MNQEQTTHVILQDTATIKANLVMEVLVAVGSTVGILAVGA